MASMEKLKITADDLLVGANATYEVEVPGSVIRPGSDVGENGHGAGAVVRLRPLTVGAFQLILKAAKEDPSLISLLMIKDSLVEPEMSLAQVRKMHLGLVEFLIGHVREISGLTEKKKP